MCTTFDAKMLVGLIRIGINMQSARQLAVLSVPRPEVALPESTRKKHVSILKYVEVCRSRKTPLANSLNHIYSTFNCYMELS